MTDITYRQGNDLDLDEVLDLYQSCSLGARRPIDDRSILADMIRHANLVITAWDSDLLVGISRSMTDFSYVAYLADLAVRESHQRMGIGVELIRRTQEAMGPRSSIVLLSAPAAVEYYPKIGFTRHESAWILKAGDPLGS
jgi:ribosomal protein S18 acetylase RimI-like enzyme